MKRMMGLLILMPALALAAKPANHMSADSGRPPAFGLSNNVVGQSPPENPDDQVTRDTRNLLNNQAHSKPAKHSEISAPVYVETQKRLSKSFQQDIKDFGKDQTTSGGTQSAAR